MKLKSLIKEDIFHIKKNMGLLLEETQGVDEFINRVVRNYPKTEKYKDKIKEFILKSGCKKIEFGNVVAGAAGFALHNGVVISNSVLSLPLDMFLFVIFHEIAHQYQYQKYGDEKMYEFYVGEISVSEAAKVMKNIEIVADEFAARKVREFVKLGLLDKIPFNKGFYKNVPLQQFEVLIKRIRSYVEKLDVKSPQKIAEIIYNMFKINT